MAEETLETYFNAEELEGAMNLIEVFHNKFLISDELSRGDAFLIGLYMLSNKEKVSEIEKMKTKDFTLRLGVAAEDYSKGLYDMKSSGFVTETDDKLGITFKGLKRIRQMLSQPPSKPQGVEEKSVAAEDQIPTVGTPATVRDAIVRLFSSEWGRKPRSLSEIIDALEVNAIYYPKGTIGTELKRMTRSATLRRLRTGNTFSYVLAKKPPP